MANLSTPRVSSGVEGFELTMTLSGPAVSRYIGRAGDTLLVRFPRGRVTAPFTQEFDRGPVRKVSLVQGEFAAELTLTLDPSAGAESVSYDSSSRVQRVWVAGSAALSRRRRRLPAPAVPQAFVPVVVAPAASGPKRPIRRIMVDPGHGGRDVGAMGLTGLLEKDVNLELAVILADQLRAKGYSVALTRSTDIFVPLSERSQMANQWGADLFVSVHCNSSLIRKAHGFEVYFLSERATDSEADATARTENSVLALERAKKMEPMLKRLLFSMAQNQFLNEASRLCAYVARRVEREVHGERPTVKQANFYVLREAGMPAVLVEFEYLSNPVSEARMRSRRYCRKLVSAVSDGIGNYESSLREHTARRT